MHESSSASITTFLHIPYSLAPLNSCTSYYSQIGVVGRTGAGKHSMVAAILRLFEPQGVIRIDGVDTGTLSLKVWP